MTIAMVQKGLEPNGCGRSTLVKNRHRGQGGSKDLGGGGGEGADLRGGKVGKYLREEKGEDLGGGGGGGLRGAWEGKILGKRSQGGKRPSGLKGGKDLHGERGEKILGRKKEISGGKRP